MRIALVGPAPPHRGGIVQYNSNLYRTLSREHECRIISFRRQYPGWLLPGKTQSDDESSQPFEVPSQPLLDPLRPWAWRRAARGLNEFRPQVLVVQWWHPFFAPAFSSMIRWMRILGRRLGNPNPCVLLLCHNVLSHEQGVFPGRASIEKRLVRLLFRQADGFLVQAESLRSKVQALAPGRPIVRIRHPIYDFFSQWDVERSDASRDRGSEQTAQLLFFGNVRPYKGLSQLLQALAGVPEGIAWKLTVAGEFFVSLKAHQRQAQDLGIGDRIEWRAGYVPNQDVPGLFRKADAVVLPYVDASQSGVVPVAYHFEVPVIATDVGGLSEVVLQGRTGYLVPPGRPDLLAQAVADCIRNREGIDFAQEIRDFRKHLSWEQVADSILEVCREIERSGREP